MLFAVIWLFAMGEVQEYLDHHLEAFDYNQQVLLEYELTVRHVRAIFSYN
ncbi:MAG: hypothetical protein JNJ58_00825 [Chitinophagaceae bacterium]|nr:hypothetical protein [Chitinophagaceae bacterium]